MEKINNDYISENVKLLYGDCLERMKEIPDNSVDLIVTDPPYLINYKTNYRKNKKHDFCTVIQNDMTQAEWNTLKTNIKGYIL